MRRKDAEEWALKMERRVDRGESVSKNIPDDLSTFAQLIDLHIADMLAVGEALRRSKTYSLDKLKGKLAHVRLEVLDRGRIIQFARDRRAEGARARPPSDTGRALPARRLLRGQRAPEVANGAPCHLCRSNRHAPV